MVSTETIQIARRTAEELRRRGEHDRARAIETLLEATQTDALPSLDMLTTTEAGQWLGVSSQTIKNWVRRGELQGYRLGSRIMVPRSVVSEYVQRARQSLDLDAISDEEAACLVDEGRRSN